MLQNQLKKPKGLISTSLFIPLVYSIKWQAEEERREKLKKNNRGPLLVHTSLLSIVGYSRHWPRGKSTALWVADLLGQLNASQNGGSHSQSVYSKVFASFGVNNVYLTDVYAVEVIPHGDFIISPLWVSVHADRYSEYPGLTSTVITTTSVLWGPCSSLK